MGHLQKMTTEQKNNFLLLQYNRKKEENKGNNFPYWNEKYDEKLNQGWKLHVFTDKTTRQWNQIFQKESVPMLSKAKVAVQELRSNGNYARIVCGYDKNKQRVKMYSVIYKLKTMKIKDLKKRLKITDTDIARMFGYKNLASYANSGNGKKKIEEGMINMYAHMRKEGWRKIDVYEE